ncbi:Orotate phosphoribosyltransferase [hydrothermal vent metagenome]|uniref:orotate phosphoribosyltransferase n=1 Tax=hydrothermal vent metagenome TaxID=652676 RepID=A0A3B0S7X6_9ZZZZ
MVSPTPFRIPKAKKHGAKALNEKEVLDEFRASDALLEGHFILSSGRHSPIFLQKMRVFQYPERTAKLCRALAEAITAKFGKVDLIISPAMGGILPGYETARALGCRAIFVEREEGEFKLRRGFEVAEGERVVMVEDIVTTGLSSRECLSTIRNYPCELLGAACLIDRSNGKADVGVPLVSLVQLDAPDYSADDLPPELAAIPAVKPGSRDLKK